MSTRLTASSLCSDSSPTRTFFTPLPQGQAGFVRSPLKFILIVCCSLEPSLWGLKIKRGFDSSSSITIPGDGDGSERHPFDPDVVVGDPDTQCCSRCNPSELLKLIQNFIKVPCKERGTQSFHYQIPSPAAPYSARIALKRRIMAIR